jgi:GNAT superfamily N-acetyltransferase
VGNGILHDALVDGHGSWHVRQVAHPHEVSAGLRGQLIDCWVTVSNAGGAVGFLPPADGTQISPVVAELIAGLDPRRSRLLLALDGAVLAGWLSIQRELNPLVAHWGTVGRLQTHPAFRGRGIASALMTRARHVARDEMRLEQLHLALRDGTGLERFYGRLGWQVTGRWPGALRVAPGDDRDEVLMILAPL